MPANRNMNVAVEHFFSSEGTLKKILLILALAGTLACNAVLGEPIAAPPPAPTFTPESIPTEMPPATAPGADPASTAAPTEGPRGFVEVRLRSRDGSLPDLLAVESQKAIALGLMPVAEFDASW